jgi:hypothetical protein
MMFVEGLLPLLAKKYPEGFTLKIKAPLIKKEEVDPNTKIKKQEYLSIGTHMEYDIITPDFTLHFNFDLQSPREKPFFEYQDYFKAFVNGLMDYCELNKANAASTSTVTTTTSTTTTTMNNTTNYISPCYRKSTLR